MDVLLVGAAGALGLALGPVLARTAVRLATRDPEARSSAARSTAVGLLTAALLAGAAALGGPRPATVALLWAAGAGVVLGAVDLLSHRLPNRVTYPAAAVCVLAFVTDAAVLGTWPALLRAVLAAAACLGAAAVLAALSPDGLGFGDVKLLGLLGLLLGWAGWTVLLVGVFLGLVTGALVALALLVTGRAGWRSAVPFGPPLLTGAALALAVAAPGAVG